jgi:hypothetical protein
VHRGGRRWALGEHDLYCSILCTAAIPLQITGSPERDLIEILSSYCADQSFDKRLRLRNVRHGFHLRHVENPEIGVPLVESE